MCDKFREFEKQNVRIFEKMKYKLFFFNLFYLVSGTKGPISQKYNLKSPELYFQ